MARPLRTEFPGAIYHVMSRGNARQVVFRDDRDYQRMVDGLEQTVDRFGWELLSFVLMPNRLHLFLRTPRPNLSRKDGLGSTRALAGSTANVTDTYTYDAYGNLSASSGSTANEFLFAGQQFDAGLGEYFNRARYYDTKEGRFTKRDSFDGKMADPITGNHYLYAAADPVNKNDPQGLMPNKEGVISLAQLLVLIQEIENLPINDRKTPFQVLESVPDRIKWKYVFVAKGGDANGTTAGYIDTYHFFRSAAGSPDPIWGYATYYGGGYGVEILQWFTGFLAGFSNPYRSSPDGDSLIGNAASAFTLEDLPSDWWGTQFGQYVYQHPDNSLSTLVSNYFNQELGGERVDPNFNSLPLNERDWQIKWWEKNTVRGWLVQTFTSGLMDLYSG
jgi:RHS repeat-associated protein